MKPTWTSKCGTVQLYLGDCLDVLPTLAPGSVDAVVTDPPYAISGGGSSIAGKGTEEAFDSQFYESWFRERADLIRRVVNERGAMWWTTDWRGLGASERALARIGGWKRKMRLAGAGVWDRGGLGMGFALRKTFEMFAIAVQPDWKRTSTDTPDVWRIQWTPGDRQSGHSAEKPLELMEKAIELVGGDVILDPYMGSGTTGVAAVRLGRKFIGIEIDPNYFEIAKRRIQDELDKVAFLEPPKRELQRTLLEAD
jgi:site-specific DNA-methyltransferase (adenine-specific)